VTLQHAGVHLRTPLFVVLGHEGCGAVKAALDAKFHGTGDRSRIEALIQTILPTLERADPGLTPDEQLHAAVEANARFTMRQIPDTPESEGAGGRGRHAARRSRGRDGDRTGAFPRAGF